MSLRRLLRKIRLRLRRAPRRASDVVRSYAEYLRLQREEYLSHEADVARWAEGLRRFVAEGFREISRSARVLDCACGDGVGLEALRAQGFADVLGVELSAEKAGRARALGFEVLECDLHDLSSLATASFDVVLSSHTLEHAYDPGRALVELRRVLKPGGTLLLVLPYPDPGARNELAHVGKYELGTHREDGGASVAAYIAGRGFEIVSLRQDAYREPELWITARLPLPSGSDPF